MPSFNNNTLNLGELLSRVFAAPNTKFQDSDSSETIKGWDSFQALILFQELEKEAGVSFSIDDLKDIRTIGDIKKLLEKYKIKYFL